MLNRQYHLNLINDVRNYKCKTSEQALTELLKKLKQAPVEYIYDENKLISIIYYYSSISSSLIKISNINNNLPSLYKQQSEEESYINELIVLLNCNLPVFVKEERLIDITYYHFLKGYSFNYMKKNNLYAYEKDTFNKDKKLIIEKMIKAWYLNKNRKN